MGSVSILHPILNEGVLATVISKYHITLTYNTSFHYIVPYNCIGDQDQVYFYDITLYELYELVNRMKQ